MSSGRRRTTTVRARVDRGRGVFMISVAAKLAEMHPQTLRMYEARGLITPQRSAKNTRLYSQADVERLRRIQRMTADEGLNLAGVVTVLELEAKLARAQAEARRLRERAMRLERELVAQLERARASRAEIVPYGLYESGGREAPVEAAPVRIPVKRGDRRPAEADEEP